MDTRTLFISLLTTRTGEWLSLSYLSESRTGVDAG